MTELNGASLVAIGSILGVFCKFLLDLVGKKAQTRKEDNDQRFIQIETERKELVAAQAAIRQDLMNQILDLRSQVLKFQEANIQYATDNAQLRAQVGSLETDNREFQGRIAELEREIEELRSRSPLS